MGYRITSQSTEPTRAHTRVQERPSDASQHARSSRRMSPLLHVWCARESTRTWWAKVGYTDLSLAPDFPPPLSAPAPSSSPLPQRFLPPTDEVPRPDSRPGTFLFQYLAWYPSLWAHVFPCPSERPESAHDIPDAFVNALAKETCLSRSYLTWTRVGMQGSLLEIF